MGVEKRIDAKTSIDENLAKGLQLVNKAFMELKATSVEASTHIKAAGEAAETSSKQAATAAGKWGEYTTKIKEAGAEMKGALLPGVGSVALGVVGLTAALSEAIKMGAQEEVGIKRLSIAIKDNVPGWDGNTAAIERVIEARKKLGVDDELQRDVLAQLVRHTHDVSDALKDEAIAMDFSRGRQISLETAANALGKALDGNVAGLRRYGVQIAANATATEAMAAVQSQFAGQSEAYAHSAAGSLDVLKVAIDDAFKKAGTALLPVVAELATRFADALPRVIDVAKGLSDALAPAFQLVGAVASPVLAILGEVGDFMLALEGKSKDAGDAVSTDFAGGVKTGMTQASQYASQGASDVMDSLDISDEAAATGSDVGTSYTGTPGGVSGAISDGNTTSVTPAVDGVIQSLHREKDAGAAGRSTAKSWLEEFADVLKSAGVLGAPAPTGGPNSDQIQLWPFGDNTPKKSMPVGGVPGSTYTPGQGPATPSYPPYNPPAPIYRFGQTPYSPYTTSATGESQASRDASEKLRQEQMAEAKASASAGKAADKGENAAAQASQNMDLFKAKQLVLHAQAALNDKMGEYEKDIQLDKDAIAALTAKENARLADLAGPMQQAEAAATANKAKDQKAIAALDEQTYQLNQQMQKLNDDTAGILAPFIADADKAKAALAALQAQTAEGDRMLDAAAHKLDVALRGPQDELEAENAALSEAEAHVNDVATAWDTKMAPALSRQKQIIEALSAAQGELNDLQNQQGASDRQKKLHDEAVSLDNIAARLVTATGAQRQQLLIQQAAAKEQLARDQAIDTVEGKIVGLNKQKTDADKSVASLQSQKEAAVKLAQENVAAIQLEIKATQAKITAIQDEQKLLDRTRTDFDFDQKQKEAAAQKDVDNTNTKLVNKQKEIDAEKARITSEENGIAELRTVKIHDDKIEQDRLDAIALGYEDAYKLVKATYDAQKLDIQSVIDKTKDAEDVATKPLEKIVEYFTANEKKLSDAYSGIDMINGAIKAGAPLTDDMRIALAKFKTDALDVVATSVDPTKPGSLASLWAKAWSTGEVKSIPSAHNAALDAMAKASAPWSSTSIHEVDLVTDAYQRLITKMGQVPPIPGGGGSSSSYNPGGHIGGFTAYRGGSSSSASSGASAGQTVIINNHNHFNGQPLISEYDITQATIRAFDLRLGRYYRDTGRTIADAVGQR